MNNFNKTPYLKAQSMADDALDPMMKPTEEISVRELFGIDTDMKVKAFAISLTQTPRWQF